ncbi:MAG: cupin domain-containing protein [Oscillospiraceae bacterium]|nr:cupin domain-containing protein [Oscillospiraceae bacterium]
MRMNEIGARMREIRDICGFEPEEVAKGLEIPLEVYLGYEQSGADIPISVMYHVANLCGVDLNELLTGVGSHLDSLCVVKRGTGLSVDRYTGYSFENLAYTFKRKMMEPLLVTVEPSADDPKLVSHGGQEFNMVLEGEIELLFENKRVLLTSGDSVYFDPRRPHGQKAIGTRARFLTVIAE